jgi:hypothetical protein
LDFIDKDGTTQNLRSLKAELEVDIDTVERVICEFRDYVAEAQDRIDEIDGVLDEREAAEDASEETVQTEAVG